MSRLLAAMAVLALAACDRAPTAGSIDDKSAQGDSVRRAVATVDAAAAEANKPAAPAVTATEAPAATP